jgi:hypothetical protein
MNVKTAVETLVASYGDIDREVASYGNLNPSDILTAFQKAKPDTAEYVVLAKLASKFPVETGTKTVKDVVAPKSVIND